MKVTTAVIHMVEVPAPPIKSTLYVSSTEKLTTSAMLEVIQVARVQSRRVAHGDPPPSKLDINKTESYNNSKIVHKNKDGGELS